VTASRVDACPRCDGAGVVLVPVRGRVEDLAQPVAVETPCGVYVRGWHPARVVTCPRCGGRKVVACE